MLTINSSQVNFTGECRDEETGVTFAYFDATYGPTQTYFGMTISQDDPQIMADFTTFKNKVMATKEEFGVIDLVDDSEEVTPEEQTPIEEM